MIKSIERVALAKDVIRQLRYLRGITQGSYLYFSIGEVNTKSYAADTNLQDILPVIRKHCHMCALGAMLVSYVNLKDEVKINNVFKDTLYRASRPSIAKILQKLFSAEQLALIETAFETNCMFYTVYPRSQDSDKAYRAAIFGKQYDDSKQRLRAIMLNIVKNNGEFIP